MSDQAPIILEFGSGFYRIGRASEDGPEVFKPTVVASGGRGGVPAASASCLLPGVEYSSPVGATDALVKDWAAVERLLADGTAACTGGCDLSASPVLLVESLTASRSEREAWCKLLFETYNCPGVFTCRSGVLALYANARVTGIAVDVGASSCTVTPVQDGFPLLMGARRSGGGARAMDERLDVELVQLNGEAYVKACRGSAGLTPSGSVAGRAWTAATVREGVGVSAHTPIDTALHAAPPVVQYTLPDGTTLSVGSCRTTCFEMLWGGPAAPTCGAPVSRVQDAVVAAAMACDPDIRGDLLSNVVLTGGGSCAPGLVERLGHELALIAPPGSKSRVAAAAPGERLHGPWLGGSILASLDAFNDFLFTLEEFRETGVQGVHKALG